MGAKRCKGRLNGHVLVSQSKAELLHYQAHLMDVCGVIEHCIRSQAPGPQPLCQSIAAGYHDKSNGLPETFPYMACRKLDFCVIDCAVDEHDSPV